MKGTREVNTDSFRFINTRRPFVSYARRQITPVPMQRDAIAVPAGATTLRGMICSLLPGVPGTQGSTARSRDRHRTTINRN